MLGGRGGLHNPILHIKIRLSSFFEINWEDWLCGCLKPHLQALGLCEFPLPTISSEWLTRKVCWLITFSLFSRAWAPSCFNLFVEPGSAVSSLGDGSGWFPFTCWKGDSLVPFFNLLLWANTASARRKSVLWYFWWIYLQSIERLKDALTVWGKSNYLPYFWIFPAQVPLFN